MVYPEAISLSSFHFIKSLYKIWFDEIDPAERLRLRGTLGRQGEREREAGQVEVSWLEVDVGRGQVGRPEIQPEDGSKEAQGQRCCHESLP